MVLGEENLENKKTQAVTPKNLLQAKEVKEGKFFLPVEQKWRKIARGSKLKAEEDARDEEEIKTFTASLLNPKKHPNRKSFLFSCYEFLLETAWISLLNCNCLRMLWWDVWRKEIRSVWSGRERERYTHLISSSGVKKLNSQSQRQTWDFLSQEVFSLQLSFLRVNSFLPVNQL